MSGMIENEPEKVMEFFKGLTDQLHDTIADKMSPTKMSSALTVYNDKKMKEEYDEYTSLIKKQEDKLNAYMDKWYAKFFSHGDGACKAGIQEQLAFESVRRLMRITKAGRIKEEKSYAGT